MFKYWNLMDINNKRQNNDLTITKNQTVSLKTTIGKDPTTWTEKTTYRMELM